MIITVYRFADGKGNEESCTSLTGPIPAAISLDKNFGFETVTLLYQYPIEIGYITGIGTNRRCMRGKPMGPKRACKRGVL